MPVEPAPLPPATDENPFAAPATGKLAFADANLADADDFDLIRRQCIRREKGIRYLSWALVASGCLITMLSLLLFAYNPRDRPVLIACILLMATGLCQAFGGYITRRLEPRGRTILTVCFGLIALSSLIIFTPLSLIYSLVILAILYFKPANIVFSERYRKEIIPATPHIQGRASILVWFVAHTTVIVPLLVIALFLILFNTTLAD